MASAEFLSFIAKGRRGTVVRIDLAQQVIQRDLILDPEPK